MNKKVYILFTSLLISLILSSCQKETPIKRSKTITPYTQNQFKAYWYEQGAEISSYHLKQARYGEIHHGESVMVFVTEPFDAKKLVKPNQKTVEHLDILKLNFTKRFYTGIYPYSIMTSAFHHLNLESSHTLLKANCSIQEWCGHVYSEIKQKNQEYNYNIASYFENESIENGKQKLLPTEEGVWTQIRIQPKQLKEGEFLILPSLEYCRLKHLAYQPTLVSAKLLASEEKSTNGIWLWTYTLEFNELNRTLSIWFEQNFPYCIEKWTERSPSFKNGIKETSASLKKRISIDYWNKNKSIDQHYQKKLSLQ